MSLGTQFGLLPTGFVGKNIEDITADLQAAFQAAFGASINVTPQSRFGQIIGIMADRYLELWNLAEAVHAAFNPDDATGQDLVNVAAITGTLPFVPFPSTVTETMTGTPGTLLPAGRQVSVQVTNSLFVTLANGTITLQPSWAAGAYAANSRVTSGGSIWQTTAGGVAALPAPTGSGPTFTDGGGVVWNFLGAGTGAVDIAMASQQNGPIVAVNHTLTQIQTPVAGWNNAVNLLDALLGASSESDSTFRLRREAELHGSGKAALEAIRSAVLKVAAVTACTVFENTTDSTNSDGMPPHSVEVLVQGGDPTAICTAIFQTVTAGIATTGNQAPITITDSQGIAHSIKFSRPVLVPIWVIVNLLFNSAQLPPGGTATVQAEVTANILSYGSILTADFDVFSSQIASAIINGVPSIMVPGVLGVLDTGAPLIGTAPGPVTNTPISITSRQLATFTGANITVNVILGSP